ncbi:MAG: M48 family metalloprotease [Bacillota bacterium]
MSEQLRADAQLTRRMTGALLRLALIYLGLALLMGLAGAGLLPVALLSGILLALQYYYAGPLLLRALQAREAASFEQPELQAMIRELAAGAGLPAPRLALVDRPAPNAFTVGRNAENAVVAVTTGLVGRLSPLELRAVLAHELSHIKNRDAAVVTLGSFFAALAVLFARQSFFWGFPISRWSGDRGVLAGLADMTAGAVGSLSLFILRALSRDRELPADRGAAELMGDPSPLAAALVNISSAASELPVPEEISGQRVLSPFFILPLPETRPGRGMPATHPPLRQRLDYLAGLENRLAGRGTSPAPG